MTLALALGPFMMAAILFYFQGTLDEEHFVLKLLMSVFGIICLVIGGSAVMDAQAVCQWGINSTATDTALNTTANTWSLYCQKEPDTASARHLFTLATWLFRLVITYAVMYLGYHVLLWMKKEAKI